MFGIDDIVGGFLNKSAAKDAAEIQANSHRDANAMQEQMYNQQRADHQPWREAGVNALSDMGSADFKRDFTANDFQADPGYAFRMAEGQKAIERSAASRGGLQSGGTLKALTQYGQGVASSEYQNAYNRFNGDRDRRFGRLSNLAGMGQNATMDMTAGSRNYANQYGANVVGAGDAQAQGRIGEAKGWGQITSGFGKMASDIASASMGMPPMSGAGGGGMDFSKADGVGGGITGGGSGKWMSRTLSSMGRG